MVGVVNIGKNASDVTKSVLLQPYSKVIITVDENTEYVAGNDSGLTLELQNPWGTQQMANDILQRILGYQYQPYTVTTAIIDPAVEMGDAVQANGVYGGIYQQDATFGRTFYSDFSAPENEQLDDENHYESPTERRITRVSKQTKAEFKILDDSISAEVQAREEDGAEFRGALQTQAQEISAKVSQTGGNNQSFGWSLLSSEFGLYSGNKKVFYCNNGGVVVNGSGTFSGEITAKSGRIGANSSGTGGFIIQANKLYTDGHPAYNTNANGVYVGTDGIGCGAGKFYVTSSGSLYAESGTFKGNITGATGTFSGSLYVSNLIFTDPSGNTVTINGSNLTSGTVGGTQLSDGSVSSGKISSGAVTNGKISNGAVTKPKTDSNVQTSLGHGDSAYAAVTSLTAGTVQSYNIKTSYMTVSNTLDASTSQATTLKVKQNSSYVTASWQEKTINGTRIKYLGSYTA